MKTIFACVAALVLQFAVAGTAIAARPELPPPGMAKYLVVLWEAGTPIPGAEGKKASGKEPDFPKLGGRVLFSRDNRRVIYLPRGEANGLRRHASVAYVQRIWVGESLEDWVDPETKNHSRFEVETDATNVSWGPVAYAYDSAGNIKGAGQDTYTYDSAGRLIEAFVGGKTEAYEYDSFGNMTRKGVTGVTATTMQVDGSSNRLIGPEYDATGNLIATGDRESYTYDSLGMMSTSVRGTTERRYIYDANEERIGRINDQYLSRWTIRDTEGRVLREFKGDDSESETFWYWEQDYVYADGQLVGGETQEWTGPNTPASTYGGRRHYHLDHLSSVRMVTNDTRGAIMRHDYYPFGVEQTAAWQELLNPGDPHVDDARFTGHERDYHGALNIENVNYLDYMHARYYDPNKGRFLSVDPKGTSAKPTLPQTWNRYAYARNNPLKYIDPDGQDVYIVVTSTVVDDTRVNSKPGGGGANETVPAYKIVMMSEAGYVDTFAGSRDTNYSGKTMNTRGEYGSDHEAPPGTYFGKMRTDGKLGPRVELSDTKGGSTIAGPDGIRSNIQIHVGPGCSQGCVLLTGGKTNRNAFINSVKFMQEEERAAGRSDQIRVVVQPRNKQECSGDRCELNPK